ncbi:MAG: SCO7613 C-terminal domain-containing membrane protein, partial [Stackebrandtia sp.]
RTPGIASVRWAVETGGHLATAAAVGLAVTSGNHLAVVLVIYGAVLGLLAVRSPDSDNNSPDAKPWYATGSALSAFAAYCLLLVDVNLSVVEFYTLPFAGLTVLGGWLEWQRRPALRSWISYGPGLLLGLLPSLAQVLFTADNPWRRLILGTGALAVLVLGSWRRLQAPVLVGGGVLVLLAGHELVLYWTRVPSWVPLALTGGLLLVLGATFENRRRDLRRLRHSVGTMR